MAKLIGWLISYMEEKRLKISIEFHNRYSNLIFKTVKIDDTSTCL